MFIQLDQLSKLILPIKKNESECLTWLNNQLPNSVLYVSFGSGGTLSQDQINELALGLELSGKKFLWVVRAPNESSSSSYLNSQQNHNDHDPLKFLPSRFIDRTKEQGFVVPYWWVFKSLWMELYT